MDNKAISFPTSTKLSKSLVLSKLLFGCEIWTSANWNKCLKKCRRRMLGVSYREGRTNEGVWQQVNVIAGCQVGFLPTVKHRKLSWLDRVCRYGSLLKNIILHGTEEGIRRKGRPPQCEGDIEEWKCQSMSLLRRTVDDIIRWATITPVAVAVIRAHWIRSSPSVGDSNQSINQNPWRPGVVMVPRQMSPLWWSPIDASHSARSKKRNCLAATLRWVNVKNAIHSSSKMFKHNFGRNPTNK